MCEKLVKTYLLTFDLWQASHLFKLENLHNWWLTKYFFAPLSLCVCVCVCVCVSLYLSISLSLDKGKCERYLLDGDCRMVLCNTSPF